MKAHLYDYIVTVADNSLILGQRLGELCGHGPTLETDIAVTNIALDLIGQARNYYQYAAKVWGTGQTEDTIAFLRLENQYKNVLLVEQPNKHFGYVMGRQFLFDAYHLLFMEKLANSKDGTLAAIAKKGIKEVSYHKRFSGDWVKRLGDGTAESNTKMQGAIDHLWTYTDELFDMTAAEKAMAGEGVGVAASTLREAYYNEVSSLLTQAKLNVPQNNYFIKGGKKGTHSEHMGYLLAHMQYMQRTYPGLEW
ncbi:MAG: 1,2-phenylacetyl-CoA epoxidase subunit PaaC [Marinirhabdus sp.]